MTTQSLDRPPTFPKCIASTQKSFCKRVAECHTAWEDRSQNHERYRDSQSNLFRGAQFTGDGTSIITHNEDQSLRTFVLPPSLLNEEQQPYDLSAYSTLPFPTPVQSYAVYPKFDLQDPSTTVVLSASKDLPITLNNLVHPDVVHATYPLIHSTTEAYIAPSSLIWTADGTRFVAGSYNRISVFDSSCDGSGPVKEQKTRPSRSPQQQHIPESFHGCKGIVSALSLSPDRILAAGTFMREIALYSQEGSGECTTSFSIGGQSNGSDRVRGTGVTQLAWSPDGTYLFVAERQSDCVQVYDVRNTMRRVSLLIGREAKTTQRLGIDMIDNASGCEVWAGGTDGNARVWKNAGLVEADQQPQEVLKVHNDPVSSVNWHPTAAVFATCSGSRNALVQGGNSSSEDNDSDNEDNVQSSDNSLRVWTL